MSLNKLSFQGSEQLYLPVVISNEHPEQLRSSPLGTSSYNLPPNSLVIFIIIYLLLVQTIRASCFFVVSINIAIILAYDFIAFRIQDDSLYAEFTVTFSHHFASLSFSFSAAPNRAKGWYTAYADGKYRTHHPTRRRLFSS
jgi:hypothetical protein